MGKLLSKVLSTVTGLTMVLSLSGAVINAHAESFDFASDTHYVSEDAEKALARINEIRKEAHDEGIVTIWGNNDAYYVPGKISNGEPLRWSEAGINFAAVRAKEIVNKWGYTRPNGHSSNYGAGGGSLECIAAESLAKEPNLDAVNLWYEEKDAYLKHLKHMEDPSIPDTKAVWGHYSTMIANEWKSVGLSTYAPSEHGLFGVYTAGEFTGNTDYVDSYPKTARDPYVEQEETPDPDWIFKYGPKDDVRLINLSTINFYNCQIASKDAIVNTKFAHNVAAIDAVWYDDEGNKLSSDTVFNPDKNYKVKILFTATKGFKFTDASDFVFAIDGFGENVVNIESIKNVSMNAIPRAHTGDNLLVTLVVGNLNSEDTKKLGPDYHATYIVSATKDELNAALNEYYAQVAQAKKQDAKKPEAKNQEAKKQSVKKANNSQKANAANNSKKNANGQKIVETADNNNVVLWAVLFILSTVGCLFAKKHASAME